MYYYVCLLYYDYSHVKDIHNSVHLVLYNDLKNKDDLIGQVEIPLLKVSVEVLYGALSYCVWLICRWSQV